MSSKKEGFCLAIDRGGTFTDIFCKRGDGSITTLKLLSVDPDHYDDAPREGIRRLLGQESPVNPENIQWIRMGTTVATNALLERKGEKVALAVTQGFRDFLQIGNQSRPNIFDLKVKCHEVLYTQVVEVDERVVLSHPKCQLKHDVRKVTSVTGDDLEVWKELDEEKLKRDLTEIRTANIDALAVILLNSYAYPDHEIKVAEVAKSLGFKYVTLSHEVMPMIKAVPRGLTTTADAYLTPKVQEYLKGFASGFKPDLGKNTVLFMKSDGGLSPVDSFNGSRAILSGPAGGVVGYSLTCQQEFGSGTPTIGFDMGGTSTDVSRFDGYSFQHTFEAVISGVTIQSPQLDIKTVAAGGGSMLFYRSGLFAVGPESAGAFPGPKCYRNNGPLTVTDANLLLGRIVPEYFPAIFGQNHDERLDEEATKNAFDSLTEEINSDLKKSGSKTMTREEVALGFIGVANEAMSRPIRSITEGKGLDSADHVLSCFGGAGGQHACSIARSLGIKKVFVHRFSGILSAYGMALADVVTEAQEPSSILYQEKSLSRIEQRFTELKKQCLCRLSEQGFNNSQIQYDCYLNMRYERTDFALMVVSDDLTTFGKKFKSQYEKEFGFSLSDREVVVDDIRVRATAKSQVNINFEVASSNQKPEVQGGTKIFFEGNGFTETPIYHLSKLFAGHFIQGPALILDNNSTILVEQSCKASITKQGNIIIDIEKEDTTSSDSGAVVLDPIRLSVMSHRFMSIAEQMGSVLQRTATSTNIKERLDFSCALFGPDGGLVSNAPHIPVHLGSMQRAVQFQIEYLGSDIHPGDVILSNHPMAGGSHLPDLTVMTPVFDEQTKQLVFFVASRGHHADIGGSTPGSMPPNSFHIQEEGATFISTKIVEKGIFQEKRVVDALMAPEKVSGCSGCRCLPDVMSDLQAQVAANNRGIALVRQLISQYGLTFVQAYMKFIQENAEVAVRDMIKKVCHGQEHKTLTASDFMDDGTEIKLKVEMNGQTGDAVFDFTGTGPEVIGNLNAPEAVSFSAIIYCLRCMIGHDVPLNQGCLKPVKVVIPPKSLLSPSPVAAVVGGNVETSQRVVDVIFKTFEACAASQGTMNNITFGDETQGYYETVAGGAGAGPSWHGTHAVHTHMTNTRITDPEILEKRYPVVVQKFSINHNTGGKGAFHGGDGSLRELLFRKDMVLSVLTERRSFAPFGLHGGSSGRRGRNLLTFASSGRTVNVGSKASVKVEAGDVFLLETPGGGGFGTPASETS